jgi:hypothetical protein
VENTEKIDIQPYIMKEEQHVVRKEIAPVVKKETKNVTKKVIQPIIKEITQPVHIKVKPILQEGIKPTIYKQEVVHQAIDQGTKNLPVSFQGTKVEREVMSGTSVKQSIVKNSVLPTNYKPTQVKPEIGGDNGEFDQQVEGGFGIRTVKVSKISAGGVHQEINEGTTVRPSIIQNSILPTIDGGTRVLKTVFGGTSTSTEGMEGGAFGVGGSQYQMRGEIGTFNVNSNLNYGNIEHRQVGIEGAGNSLIMGVNNGEGDNAPDVTYSTKPNSTLGEMTSSRVIV